MANLALAKAEVCAGAVMMEEHFFLRQMGTYFLPFGGESGQ